VCVRVCVRVCVCASNICHYFSSVSSAVGFVVSSGWSVVLFSFSSNTFGLAADLKFKKIA